MARNRHSWKQHNRGQENPTPQPCAPVARPPASKRKARIQRLKAQTRGLGAENRELKATISRRKARLHWQNVVERPSLAAIWTARTEPLEDSWAVRHASPKPLRAYTDQTCQPEEWTATPTTKRFRAWIEAHRAAHSRGMEEKTLARLVQLVTPDHAKFLLDKRCLSTTHGPLHCWAASGATNTYGYYRTSLLNTRSWVAGEEETKIGLTGVLLHQLVIIAKGDGEQLKRCNRKSRTRPALYHVSHLCHNTGCIRPDHIIVEEGGRNVSRTMCMYQKIVDVRGRRYHPCPHGGKDNQYHRCILPVARLKKRGFYSNRYSNYPSPNRLRIIRHRLLKRTMLLKTSNDGTAKGDAKWTLKAATKAMAAEAAKANGIHFHPPPSSL